MSVVPVSRETYWKSLALPFTLAVSLLALHSPLHEALQPVEALSARSRSRLQPWPSLTSHQFYVHTFPQGVEAEAAPVQHKIKQVSVIAASDHLRLSFPLPKNQRFASLS